MFSKVIRSLVLVPVLIVAGTIGAAKTRPPTVRWPSSISLPTIKPRLPGPRGQVCNLTRSIRRAVSS